MKWLKPLRTFYPVMSDRSSAACEHLAKHRLVRRSAASVVNADTAWIAEQTVHDEILAYAAVSRTTQYVRHWPSVPLGNVSSGNFVDRRPFKAPPNQENKEQEHTQIHCNLKDKCKRERYKAVRSGVRLLHASSTVRRLCVKTSKTTVRLLIELFSLHALIHVSVEAAVPCETD